MNGAARYSRLAAVRDSHERPVDICFYMLSLYGSQLGSQLMLKTVHVRRLGYVIWHILWRCGLASDLARVVLKNVL